MPKKKTQIFSIFGEIEEVIAREMIKEHERDGKVRYIAPEHIPPTVRTNELGQVAKFAVVVAADLIPSFENRIADLRA